MMRATCSRCRKTSEIVFTFERITKALGCQEVKFCQRCTNWALMHLLQISDTNYETIFDRAREQSEWIKEQQDKQKLATKMAKMLPQKPDVQSYKP